MNIDEFESVFKSAAKAQFEYQDIHLKKALVVHDLDTDQRDGFAQKIQVALSNSLGEFESLYVSPQDTISQLLESIEKQEPDLVCTYRNLHSSAWEFGYSLGEHLEVLTQATALPILVLPHPKVVGNQELMIPNRVMVASDSLTGDDHLINFALSFTPSDGHVLLSHVEDEIWLNRYLECLSKIPEIDTELARDTITHQIMKEPTDFIKSVQDALTVHRPNIKTISQIEIGSELKLYAEWIKTHGIDLAVINTKDEHQTAISGFAHAFAIEFRNIPILML